MTTIPDFAAACGHRHDINSFDGATAWLRCHADELQEAPTRMHDAALGEAGTPRYSAPFWSLLTHGPFATRDVTEKRSCPLEHGYGDACERCGGEMTYNVERTFYRAPLAAALASLRKAPPSSPDWPPPYVMCLTLMRTGGDLYVAARLIGHEITSLDHRGTVEAAFTLAVRRLAGRWASGPVPKTPQRSEAQSVAEFGSEAA